MEEHTGSIDKRGTRAVDPQRTELPRSQAKRATAVVVDEDENKAPKSQAEPKDPAKRRRLRRAIAIVGAGAVLGETAVLSGAADVVLGAAANLLNIRGSRQENKAAKPGFAEAPPQAVQSGKYTLYLDKGTLRLDPNHWVVFEKDPAGHDYDANLVSLRLISTLNGVSLNGKITIEVENAEEVYGYNPADATKKDGLWLRFKATGFPLSLQTPSLTETYVYYNISNQTQSGFDNTRTGAIHNVTGEQNGVIMTKDNTTFNKAEVGKITFPQSK